METERKNLAGESQNSRIHSATGELDFYVAERRVFVMCKDGFPVNQIFLPLAKENLSVISKKGDRG